MELTSELVLRTYIDCLFRDGEDTNTAVITEAVMTTSGFNPERLKENEGKIIEMLNELPDQFKASVGGGWSFLNMLEDRHGNQWTGLHESMDQLLALGKAIGKISFPLPRDMWNVLPGGMPYVTYNDE